MTLGYGPKNPNTVVNDLVFLENAGEEVDDLVLSTTPVTDYDL